MSQPSGTVTFLFTDIQGSTRLWEQFPQSMGGALARHDEILHEAIAAEDGYVFKTVGDAFCAAFHTAPNALTAALNAQIALSGESWPEGIHVAVRMALHSGAAEVRNSDYFGQPLNRVARLLSIGHGGQVLLSAAAQQLCRDELPSESSLISLGDHRLRDLGRAEHVYQLVHILLADSFPKLKSLEEHPGNLPEQLTSFVGRTRELGELQRHLAENRSVTLTGAGGCGKTRLSLQLAADALDTFEEGAWLVELAPITNPEIVPQTVARVVGAKEEPGKPILESLAGYLRERKILLILDNCEHLLDACAGLAEAVLRRCPDVKILATSREALGVPGEINYRVPSLSAPDPRLIASPASLSPFESVRLFIDRALSHLPAFAVSNENAPALASVCHRLDGIPLAIELAAARVRSMSVEEIDRRLDHRFSLLTGGARTHLPRQQTLRSLIDWSYDLLSEPEQTLLSHLSIFRGGWTLEAAERVCALGDIQQFDVVDLLIALVDKSLVVTEERKGSTRYRLLETVREYASERLAEASQELLAAQHLAYFLSLAVQREPDFRGPKQQEWVAQLDLDSDNCRAALRWSLTEGRDVQSGLHLAASIWRYWYMRGYLREGLGWLSEAETSRAADLPAEVRAKALNGAGVMAWVKGDLPLAQRMHERALEMNRQVGDRRATAISLNNLGLVRFDYADFEGAASLYGQAVVIMRELGDLYGVASILNAQGNAAFYLGQLEEACALMEESIEIKKQIGDRHGIAMSLTNLSLAVRELGRLEPARSLLMEANAIYDEMDDRSGFLACLEAVGYLAIDDGEFDKATENFLRCLNIAVEDGNGLRTSTSLVGLAETAAKMKSFRRAAQLWGYAALIREELSMPMPPPDARAYARSVAEVLAALSDPSQFDAWLKEGHGLSREQAVQLARASA
jgi:predicted ATPase/class 3 adenylate cyclase